MYNIVLLIIIVILCTIYFNKVNYEHFINNNNNLLTDMEMKSISVFKDYNPASFRQFRLGVKQYNHLKTIYPYSRNNLIYLNRRLLENYDAMTFHLPYRQLDEIASGIRYELKLRLESDRYIFLNTSNTYTDLSKYSESPDVGTQLAIPENKSPIWF